MTASARSKPRNPGGTAAHLLPLERDLQAADTASAIAEAPTTEAAFDLLGPDMPTNDRLGAVPASAGLPVPAVSQAPVSATPPPAPDPERDRREQLRLDALGTVQHAHATIAARFPTATARPANWPAWIARLQALEVDYLAAAWALDEHDARASVPTEPLPPGNVDHRIWARAYERLGEIDPPMGEGECGWYDAIKRQADVIGPVGMVTEPVRHWAREMVKAAVAAKYGGN